MQAHILLVEDDNEYQELVCHALTEYGFRVSTAQDGLKALDLLTQNNTYDLLILDLQLPGLSGVDLCKYLRANNNMIPIIMLTSLDDSYDRIIGLEIGADHYLSKSCHLRELVAHIHALIRRQNQAQKPSDHHALYYNFAHWKLDIAKHELHASNGKKIFLHKSLYELLLIFLKHPNTTISRERILTLLGGQTIDHLDRSIDVKISRLRKILNSENTQSATPLIKSLRSYGYRFECDVTKSN